ncbi:hypothetical protein OHV05_38185 (plasmid) [Kitasatospora sp. NBC_00070]|uniref:hypothetical protein n=1 Tax=Kitasatospora sp. NBC_00070 TaxID=2975962 RepID=UPI002F917693
MVDADAASTVWKKFSRLPEKESSELDTTLLSDFYKVGDWRINLTMFTVALEKCFNDYPGTCSTFVELAREVAESDDEEYLGRLSGALASWLAVAKIARLADGSVLVGSLHYGDVTIRWTDDEKPEPHSIAVSGKLASAGKPAKGWSSIKPPSEATQGPVNHWWQRLADGYREYTYSEGRPGADATWSRYLGAEKTWLIDGKDWWWRAREGALEYSQSPQPPNAQSSWSPKPPDRSPGATPVSGTTAAAVTPTTSTASDSTTSLPYTDSRILAAYRHANKESTKPPQEVLKEIKATCSDPITRAAGLKYISQLVDSYKNDLQLRAPGKVRTSPVLPASEKPEPPAIDFSHASDENDDTPPIQNIRPAWKQGDHPTLAKRTWSGVDKLGRTRYFKGPAPTGQEPEGEWVAIDTEPEEAVWADGFAPALQDPSGWTGKEDRRARAGQRREARTKATDPVGSKPGLTFAAGEAVMVPPGSSPAAPGAGDEPPPPPPPGTPAASPARASRPPARRGAENARKTARKNPVTPGTVPPRSTPKDPPRSGLPTAVARALAQYATENTGTSDLGLDDFMNGVLGRGDTAGIRALTQPLQSAWPWDIATLINAIHAAKNLSATRLQTVMRNYDNALSLPGGVIGQLTDALARAASKFSTHELEQLRIQTRNKTDSPDREFFFHPSLAGIPVLILPPAAALTSPALQALTDMAPVNGATFTRATLSLHRRASRLRTNDLNIHDGDGIDLKLLKQALRLAQCRATPQYGRNT